MPTMRLSPASTEDYRLLAEKRLPRRLFDIIDGGSYYETTLRANSDDFRRLKLRQRVLRDVSDIDTSTTLFGHRWSMPVALAPTGMGGMMARRGEVMAKKAADLMGVPMCLSAMSICSMEEVAAVSDIPFWFQLYMMRDRDIVDQILRRAENLGIRTLVFTVDLAVVGARYRDVRNGIHDLRFWSQFRGGFLSYATHPGWAWSVGINGKPHTFGNIAEFAPKAKTPGEFGAWVQQQFDASVTWKDIEWLRARWKGDLVIKGILDAEDAYAACDAGADAVIVSNHGGRQLDSASSTIAILPKIVEAVADRAVVLIDGGVHGGLDVTKALALGASGTLMGRPWLYAIAARGQVGLEALLGTYQREMTVAMALTGAPTVGDLTAECIQR